MKTRIGLTLFLVLAMAPIMALHLACSNKSSPTSSAPVTVVVTNTFTITGTPTSTGLPTSTTTATATSTPTKTTTSTATLTATPTITPTFTNTCTYTPTATFQATIAFTAQITNVSDPNGLAVDSTGTTIYAADDTGDVRQFISGTLTNTFTSCGTIAFNEPSAVAISGSNVFITDESNEQVYELTSAGVSVASWSGYGSTAYLEPAGIAVDSAGNVYVADSGNNAVYEYNSSFTPVTAISSDGTNTFDQPSALVVDSSNHIYISDSGNGYIDEFASGGSSLLNQININNAEPGAFITGIALDSGGNVYAADQNDSVVEVWSPSSALLSVFGQGGVSSAEAFQYLTGVAIGGGSAWTTDYQNASGTGSIEQWGPVF